MKRDTILSIGRITKAMGYLILIVGAIISITSVYKFESDTVAIMFLIYFFITIAISVSFFFMSAVIFSLDENNVTQHSILKELRQLNGSSDGKKSSLSSIETTTDSTTTAEPISYSSESLKTESTTPSSDTSSKLTISSEFNNTQIQTDEWYCAKCGNKNLLGLFCMSCGSPRV